MANNSYNQIMLSRYGSLIGRDGCFKRGYDAWWKKNKKTKEIIAFFDNNKEIANHYLGWKHFGIKIDIEDYYTTLDTELCDETQVEKYMLAMYLFMTEDYATGVNDTFFVNFISLIMYGEVKSWDEILMRIFVSN